MFSPCFVIQYFVCLGRERELAAMCFNYLVTGSVLWLFLMVLWVGLQCTIVVFPDHTHLLFSQKKSAFREEQVLILEQCLNLFNILL